MEGGAIAGNKNDPVRRARASFNAVRASLSPLALAFSQERSFVDLSSIEEETDDMEGDKLAQQIRMAKFRRATRTDVPTEEDLGKQKGQKKLRVDDRQSAEASEEEGGYDDEGDDDDDDADLGDVYAERQREVQVAGMMGTMGVLAKLKSIRRKQVAWAQEHSGVGTDQLADVENHVLNELNNPAKRKGLISASTKVSQSAGESKINFRDPLNAAQTLMKKPSYKHVERQRRASMAGFTCKLCDGLLTPIQSRLTTENLIHADDSGVTWLHLAAWNGHAKCVRSLIAKDAPILPDEDGSTPLHYAAYRGNSDCIRIMAIKKPNFSEESNMGLTPLHCAAEQGKIEAVLVLLEHGANPNASKCVDIRKKTPLMCALMNYSENLKKRRRAGDNMESDDLMQTSMEIVALLLTYGAHLFFRLFLKAGPDAILRLVSLLEVHIRSRLESSADSLDLTGLTRSFIALCKLCVTVKEKSRLHYKQWNDIEEKCEAFACYLAATDKPWRWYQASHLGLDSYAQSEFVTRKVEILEQCITRSVELHLSQFLASADIQRIVRYKWQGSKYRRWISERPHLSEFFAIFKDGLRMSRRRGCCDVLWFLVTFPVILMWLGWKGILSLFNGPRGRFMFGAISYIVYVLILLGLVGLHVSDITMSSAPFVMSTNIKHRMLEDEFDYTNEKFPTTFSDVINYADMFNFLKGPFLATIYQNTWYDGATLSGDDLTDFYSHLKPLGKIRFRQVRMKRSSCSDQDNWQSPLTHCVHPTDYEFYSEVLEGEADGVVTEDQYVKTNGLYWSRTETWYPESGYVQDLSGPYDITPTEASTWISNLESSHWIDYRTRALFIDMALYNSNVRSVSVVRLLFEHHGGGAILPEFDIEVLSAFTFQTEEFPEITIMESVFFLYSIALAVQTMSGIIFRPKKWIRSFWNLYDLLYFSLVFLAFVFRVTAFSLEANNPINVADKYLELRPIALAFTYERNVLALCVILAWLRLLNFLSIDHRVGPLLLTIYRMISDIILFLVILGTVVIGFSVAMYYLYGGLVRGFSSPYRSIVTMTLVMFGEFGIFEEVMHANRIMGPFLLGIYTTLVIIMLLNLLIAILNHSYEEIEQNSDREWKYQMGSVVIEYERRSLWRLAPINLVTIPLMFVYRLFKKTLRCCMCCKRTRNSVHPGDDTTGQDVEISALKEIDVEEEIDRKTGEGHSNLFARFQGSSPAKRRDGLFGFPQSPGVVHDPKTRPSRDSELSNNPESEKGSEQPVGNTPLLKERAMRGSKSSTRNLEEDSLSELQQILTAFHRVEEKALDETGAPATDAVVTEKNVLFADEVKDEVVANLDNGTQVLANDVDQLVQLFGNLGKTQEGQPENGPVEEVDLSVPPSRPPAMSTGSGKGSLVIQPLSPREVGKHRADSQISHVSASSVEGDHPKLTRLNSSEKIVNIEDATTGESEWKTDEEGDWPPPDKVRHTRSISSSFSMAHNKASTFKKNRKIHLRKPSRSSIVSSEANPLMDEDLRTIDQKLDKLTEHIVLLKSINMDEALKRHFPNLHETAHGAAQDFLLQQFRHLGGTVKKKTSKKNKHYAGIVWKALAKAKTGGNSALGTGKVVSGKAVFSSAVKAAYKHREMVSRVSSDRNLHADQKSEDSLHETPSSSRQHSDRTKPDELV